jgi:hypothetical protein
MDGRPARPSHIAPGLPRPSTVTLTVTLTRSTRLRPTILRRQPSSFYLCIATRHPVPRGPFEPENPQSWGDGRQQLS